MSDEEHEEPDEDDIPEECPECKGPLEYSARFDAYYCDACRTWAEGTCDDPSCQQCGLRPETPPTEPEGP